MDDFSTASTETSTPDVSSSAAADTAAASSSGEGTQTQTQIPAADATATATTDGQIDAGWSLDDEANVEPAIPEDDSDLEELQKDPALDPARTPGLVAAIKQARTENRQLARQVAEFKQQTEAFEQWGGMELAEPRLNLMNQLLGATPETGGTIPVLQTLFDQAYPVYEQLIGDAVRSNPTYAIEQLRAAGHIPAEFGEQQSATLDADTLATIPDHLRDVAKSLPKNVMDELLLADPEVRDWNLERERQMQEMTTTQRQQAEQAWNRQVDSAKREAFESVNKISSQYEQAHYAQLAKWNPFGPEQGESNERLYGSMVEGAMAQLLKDQKFAQMYQDANRLLQEAPMQRLRNEAMAATAGEREARRLASQFNTRLGQILKTQVKEMDSVFRDARAFREQQRQNTPNRTEISGISTQVSNGNGVKALDSKGRMTDAYIQELAQKYMKQ